MSIFPANRVPDILKRMDLNASQAEAMKTCFGILAIMSREDVNKAMIAKDGMEIILNAMTIHVDRTDVQESGCDLLWSLAFNSSIVKDIIAKHGGSNVLVRALKRHSRSADFLKSACGALSNMCQSKLNQEGVASQGGLQPLVGSIHVHQTNPKLLPFIFDAIASIIVNNEENARSVSSLGLVPVVVASLSRHKGSMEVVKSGCHALAILSDVKGQASKIAFAGGVPIILSLLDIHPLYADLHRVAAVVLLRMLQESAHVGREIANHDGIRILLTSLEKGGAQTDTVAAVTHILYTVTNPSSAIGSIIEPQLWATRTVSIEEELLVGRRGKVTVESGYSDGGVGHITSLGGVVSVLGEFSSRRDVVRAACRLLTNLSSFPHVVTALDRLGVLDRMLECVSLHRDTKDVLESTASFLKYIHRQAIPLLSGQRAASVHGLLHVMRVKAHDEDIATACVDTAAKLIEASNRAPLEKRREYDEARQLEGSSYEYHALSVGIGLLTSLADEGGKDEAGSGAGKGASGTTAAAAGVQASPQQVAAPKLTWGKNPCRLISSVLSLIEVVQQTHKLTSDPIMHKDASTALSAVLRVLKQQQVQQKTVDLSKRIERLLPSLEYPPRSQSSPNLRRQLSFKPAQQLPFANPEDSLSNGFLFNGSQARLHSSSSRSSEAPLDEQLPLAEGASGKASASSSSNPNPSQLSTSDSFPSAGADVAAPKRMKTGDGYKAAAAASRLLPSDAESAADKRPVVTVSTAVSNSSCNRPQHPLKDKDKGGGKLLLDTWPNYLERLSVSSNPLTAANRSFLNASGESTPSRMHLCYEGGSAAGLGLFSRVPTPVPYVVPSSGLGEPFAHSLTFDSEFESGNLLRAVQRGDQHYDLFLRSDLHTPGHTQWFYFAVGNTHSEELVRLSKEGVSIPPVRVRFNIVNFTKPDSLFNLGMRPVLYSVMDADSKGAGWVRAGSDISYYPNTFIRNNSAGEGLQCYYTLTFTIDFLNPKDTVLIAYSYPYTYTDYRSQLRDILARPHSADVIRQFKLCPSLAGNDCDLLVITNYRDKDKERIGAISAQSLQEASSGRDDSGGQQAAAATAGLFSKRRKDKPAPLPLKPGLVLSCRVHPGETPASWMMKGMLEFLTSDCSQAVLLRQVFVIFIVPMLNPDGVIYGNNRCSLSWVDLNRQWKSPVKALHPPVYHLKAFMQAQKKMGRDISMYIDLHGHSRKYNVFMYGVDDKRKPRPQVRAFPKFFSMHEVGKKYVCYADCSFAAKKGRESTARVVVSKELNIPCSFTLEATFCGSNYGPLKHCHMNTGHMQEVGTALCDAILNFSISEGQVKDALLVQVPPNILKAVQLVERAIAAEGCYPDDDLLHGSVSEGAGMGVIELTRSTGSCQGRKAILADESSHHVAAVAAVAAAESKDKDKQQAFDGEELTGGAEVEAPLDSASEDAASDEGSDAESLATIDQPMAKGAETGSGLTAGIASLSSQQRLVLHEGDAMTMTMLTTPSPPPVGSSSSSPFKQQQGGSPLTGISSLGSGAHLLAAIQPAHLHLPSFNSAADADRAGKPLLHQGSSSLIQAGAKDDSVEDGLADHHPYDDCADDDSDEEAQLQYAAEDSNALATTGQSAVLFRKSKKSKKKKPASANKDAKIQKTLPFVSLVFCVLSCLSNTHTHTAHT